MRTAVLLSLCVLLAGCVQVDIDQTLHRDRTMDYALSFTAEPTVLIGFRDLPADPAVADRRTVTDNGTTITYRYAGVPLDAKSFATGENASFFQVERYTLVKRAGFPFTRYTYTATIGNDLQDTSGQAAALAGSVPITLRVGTFGAVTDTDGERVDARHVAFRVDPTVVREYTVTFHELFFRDWFG